MKRLKVGAFLSSFKLDFQKSLKKASEIGLAGIQLSSLNDEIDVENISSAQAGGIVKAFKDHGLTISSVCGDIGGFATEDQAVADDRVKRTKAIMDTTSRLGCKIVQTHIGFIEEDFSKKSVTVMSRCLEEIGKYGQKIGVVLATETGPEPAERMKRFLDRLGVAAVKVNYDPANLVMGGFDHLGGVSDLKAYIVHSHAKDGLRKPDAQGRQEQPLGQGEVDWPRYIAAMDAIGFTGFYTIERECGEDPAADIALAKRFLDQF